MSKNILVVDDEPRSLKFVSRFLRKEGYEVTEANDGAEAIKLIDNSQFDLVLSDIRCPASTVWLLRCMYVPEPQPFRSS
jgi:CheY-like chemotaxis protein